MQRLLIYQLDGTKKRTAEEINNFLFSHFRARVHRKPNTTMNLWTSINFKPPPNYSFAPVLDWGRQYLLSLIIRGKSLDLQ